jgi:hypothetical protein
MNCAECRDNLVACLEGLLDDEPARQCREHLESCAACRAEYAAITRLQERLAASGRAAAEVSLVGPVMRRVRQEQTKKERSTIMSRLFTRWGLGLSAAAGAAAVTMIIALSAPRAHGKAADVMAKGAQAAANLTSIHVRGQMRTYPADNFGSINAESPFCTVELWKQYTPQLQWRVEKPGRVAVMDGQSTVLYMKPPHNTGYKVPHPASSAFDTDWLHGIANLSNNISNDLRHAQALGWKLDLTQETAADGSLQAVVTVQTTSGVPDDDYCKNSFLGNADTRRVYHFDDQTGQLKAAEIYLVRSSGEVQIFQLTQIDYNPAIDPSVFQLQLPADVAWEQDPQTLPDNDKYASMTAEQAARAFFEACATNNWDEAAKFMSPITDRTKEYLGGLQIVSLGEAFTSKNYPGRLVPYEIKLAGAIMNVRLANTNAAKRFVLTGVYDSKLKLQQDLKWSSEPQVLSNNDAYAKLSPTETVQAYFDAQAKFDWVEMRKFTSQFDVDETKGQVETAQKSGMDVSKLMPVFKAGEAVWSPEQSAYFVKCQVSSVKKHNIAVRKDNAAGRWQVDGGI